MFEGVVYHCYAVDASNPCRPTLEVDAVTREGDLDQGPLLVTAADYLRMVGPNAAAACLLFHDYAVHATQAGPKVLTRTVALADVVIIVVLVASIFGVVAVRWGTTRLRASYIMSVRGWISRISAAMLRV